MVIILFLLIYNLARNTLEFPRLRVDIHAAIFSPAGSTAKEKYRNFGPLPMSMTDDP